MMQAHYMIVSVIPHLLSYRVSLSGGLSSTPVQVRVITGDRSCITVTVTIVDGGSDALCRN